MNFSRILKVDGRGLRGPCKGCRCTSTPFRDGATCLRSSHPFWGQVSPRLLLFTTGDAKLTEPVIRLYFTTFAGIAPNQQALNASIKGPEDNPPLRRSVMANNDTGVPKYYFFTIDHSLHYESFYEDWGPLNLANVFRTLILIHELLQVSRAIHLQPRCLNATPVNRTRPPLAIGSYSIPQVTLVERPMLPC